MSDCILTDRPLFNGYGRLWTKRHGRIIQRAHVLAWVEAHGCLPSAEKPYILHHCDNRACVNVEHLYAGTHADNMRDIATRHRQPNRRKTSCPAGHAYSAANTYEHSGRRHCKQCERDRNRRIPCDVCGVLVTLKHLKGHRGSVYCKKWQRTGAAGMATLPSGRLLALDTGSEQ